MLGHALVFLIYNFVVSRDAHLCPNQGILVLYCLNLIALTCQNHERLVKTMNDMLITLSINGYDKTDAYAIIQVFN